MKKSLAFASVLFALGCAVALIVHFAVHTSVSALNLPFLFSVLFGSSLLFLAFSDYARKPRFRGYGRRNPSAPATTPAKSSEVDAASAWTYTTLSA